MPFIPLSRMPYITISPITHDLWREIGNKFHGAPWLQEHILGLSPEEFMDYMNPIINQQFRADHILMHPQVYRELRDDPILQGLQGLQETTPEELDLIALGGHEIGSFEDLPLGPPEGVDLWRPAVHSDVFRMAQWDASNMAQQAASNITTISSNTIIATNSGTTDANSSTITTSAATDSISHTMDQAIELARLYETFYFSGPDRVIRDVLTGQVTEPGVLNVGHHGIGPIGSIEVDWSTWDQIRDNLDLVRQELFGTSDYDPQDIDSNMSRDFDPVTYGSSELHVARVRIQEWQINHRDRLRRELPGLREQELQQLEDGGWDDLLRPLGNGPPQLGNTRQVTEEAIDIRDIRLNESYGVGIYNPQAIEAIRDISFVQTPADRSGLTWASPPWRHRSPTEQDLFEDIILD